MSKEELDNTIPVKPPTVNRNTNPMAHNIGVSREMWEFIPVRIHLNVFTPVGTAIIIVAAVKYARVSISIPTVNMWCAHTRNPKIPIAVIE